MYLWYHVDDVIVVVRRVQVLRKLLAEWWHWHAVMVYSTCDPYGGGHVVVGSWGHGVGRAVTGCGERLPTANAAYCGLEHNERW